MDLERGCREVFEGNRRNAFGGNFHLLSAESFPALLAQESGYHALALRHLDLDLALEELRTAYRANGLDGGALAHERALPDELERRDERVGKLGPIYREDGRSWLIDPPVLAYAAARVAASAGAGARELLESATAHLESGTEGSPLFDAVVDATEREEWCDEIANLTRSAVACGFDPERALRAGHPFVVEDPVFCGWFLLALEETKLAWEAIGDDRATLKLKIRSEMIAEAMNERLWWEEQEIYAGFDRGRNRPMLAVTAGGLIPAATRSLIQEGSAKRVIERHLRPSAAPLWGTCGLSFNPVDRDRPIDPGEVRWRGNVAFGVTYYWGHLALVRGQRISDARVARSQLEDRIAQQGFREYYDAVSGEGFGAGAKGGFTLPALALEMRASES
jgi:hypothetical protein